MKSTYNIQNYEGEESSAIEQQQIQRHEDTTSTTTRSESAAAQAEVQRGTRRDGNDHLRPTFHFTEYPLSLLETRTSQWPECCFCSNNVIPKERAAGTTNIAGRKRQQQYLIDIVDDVLAILEEDSDSGY